MAGNGPWLAVCAVLALACGKDDGQDGIDAGPRAAAPFRSALIGEPAPVPEPFRLVLESPGAEPRRLLRYQVPNGTREQTRVSIANTIEIFIAGRRFTKMTPPSTEVGFALSVERRPGGYRCTAWITEASSTDWERMAPGRGSELRQSLEQLHGHQIGFEVDDRGTPVSASITLPDKLDKNRGAALEVLKSVDGSVVPFPAEPVGVGAIWKVTDAEPGRSNLAGPVTMTYTVVGMRSDRIELTMALGLPEEPAPMGADGEGVAGYSAGRTEGTMRMAVDLRRLLPVEYGGAIKSEVEGRTFQGAEVLPFKALGNTEIRMRTR